MKDHDKSLFAYAAYSLLFGAAPILIILSLGILFGMVREGILIIVPFMLLRKFSGGFHLNSPSMCIITSTIILGLSLVVVKIVSVFNLQAFLLPGVITAAISIWHLSPIDSDARRLSEKEVIVFRRIARIFLILDLVVFLILYVIGIHHIACPIGMGVIIASLLQLPCIIPMSSKK